MADKPSIRGRTRGGVRVGFRDSISDKYIITQYYSHHVELGDVVLWAHNQSGTRPTENNFEWARVIRNLPHLRGLTVQSSERLFLSNLGRLPYHKRIKVYRRDADGKLFCVNPGDGWKNWRVVQHFQLVVGSVDPQLCPVDYIAEDIVRTAHQPGMLDEVKMKCIELFFGNRAIHAG